MSDNAAICSAGDSREWADCWRSVQPVARAAGGPESDCVKARPGDRYRRRGHQRYAPATDRRSYSQSGGARCSDTPSHTTAPATRTVSHERAPRLPCVFLKRKPKIQ